MSKYYRDISDHEWYSDDSGEDAGQPRRKSITPTTGGAAAPATEAPDSGPNFYPTTGGVETLTLEYAAQYSFSRGHKSLFTMSSPRSIFPPPSVPYQPTASQWMVGDKQQADSLLVELGESPPSAMKGDTPYDPSTLELPMPKTDSHMGTGWCKIKQDTSRSAAKDEIEKGREDSMRNVETLPANSRLGDLDMNQHGAWYTPTPDRPPTIDPEDLQEAFLLPSDNTHHIGNGYYHIDSVETAGFSNVPDEQEWDRCDL